jgi:hypothetical protein
MTLRDKFGEVHIEKGMAKELEKIADDYAIEILETYHNGIFHIRLKEGEAKKIVEYIKSKKGL